MECEVHHFMPELSRGKVIGNEYEIEVICAKCNKHFEFDISTIKGNRITLICPWCDYEERNIYHCNEILSSDRVVRCD